MPQRWRKNCKKIQVNNNRPGMTPAVTGTVMKGFHPVKLKAWENVKYRLLFLLYFYFSFTDFRHEKEKFYCISGTSFMWEWKSTLLLYFCAVLFLLRWMYHIR